LALSSRSRGADFNPVSEQGPSLSAQDRVRRSEFFASKLGLEFGVPAAARRSAIIQAAATALSFAVTPTKNAS
jgi:hypothetical protein